MCLVARLSPKSSSVAGDLRPGDVAIFATPPAFRWVHFTYAIEKGINVFMEKPVTVDGPTRYWDERGNRRTLIGPAP